MDTKTFRSHGKRWTLPVVLRFGKRYSDYGFDGGHAGEYEVEWRAPRKGEWFLSGSVITAYEAFADMPEPSLVVTKIHEVERVTSWRRI